VGATINAGQTVASTAITENESPVQVNNFGSTALEGGTDGLTQAELRYDDPEQPPTSVTYTVTAAPVNGQLEFAVTPGAAITSFTQDDINNNRVVYVHNGLETTSDSFAFTVSDLVGGVLGGQTFTVTVTPVNDAPVLADQILVVDENSVAGIPVGTVSVSDPDAGDTHSYTILGGSGAGAFSIDAATGQIVVVDASALDFETNPIFTLQVQVTDSGAPGLSDTANVTIQLNDLAESVTPPPGPGPGPAPIPPPDPGPGPDPDPTPDPDDGGDDGEVGLGGGDDGGGGNPAPASEPEPVPEPEPEPEPTPEPTLEAEPVPEPVPEPKPVVEAVVQPKPEPAVVKIEREPREKVEKSKPAVVAKAMDINREPDRTTPFRQAMNVMSEGVGTTDIFDEVQNNTLRTTFKGSSFVLSAGFLTWALRGATLLASVAASLPAWQGFDPLPVLAAKKRDKKKDKKKDEDGDDNGDEKNDGDWQEKRLQRLFNPMDSTGND
jgi:hypothetical protein